MKDTAMKDAAKEARNSGPVRSYLLFCFAALFCMVPVLLLMDMDLWCILPLVLGALSLITNWRAGPIFVLLSLTLIISLRARGLDPITCVQLKFLDGLPEGMRPRSTPFLDGLLSVCVLAYLVGHYRLQSLIYHVVPPDPRLQIRAVVVKGRKPTPTAPLLNPRRLPGLLTQWELPLLGVVTLVSALGAEYVWLYLRGLKTPLQMWLGGWQTVTFVWVSACLLLLAWAGFGYYGRHRAKREQSLLYLQDQLWLETRREQGRISRWVAWARVRYQADKEEESR